MKCPYCGDKSREVFDRQKLLNGMLRACQKRPVSYQQLDEAVERIEQQLLNSYDREVLSMKIGDLAMQELKKMDDVAYVRFASVYRQFSDVNCRVSNVLRRTSSPHNRIECSASAAASL